MLDCFDSLRIESWEPRKESAMLMDAAPYTYFSNGQLRVMLKDLSLSINKSFILKSEGRSFIPEEFQDESYIQNSLPLKHGKIQRHHKIRNSNFSRFSRHLVWTVQGDVTHHWSTEKENGNGSSNSQNRRRQEPRSIRSFQDKKRSHLNAV